MKELDHNRLTQDLRMGLKSDHGTKLLAGIRMDAVVLARESAISLPEIPVWPGTQRN